MKINRKIAEQIIGFMLIAWSCVTLYITTISFKYILESLNLSWEEISIFNVIKNYHFQFIIPVLTITSVVLLILNKRIGWVGSTVMSFVYGLWVLIVLLRNLFVDGIYETEVSNSVLIITSLITTFFLILGVALLHKVFREKYQPTKKTWLAMTLTIIVLSVDIFFNT